MSLLCRTEANILSKSKYMMSYGQYRLLYNIYVVSSFRKVSLFHKPVPDIRYQVVLHQMTIHVIVNNVFSVFQITEVSEIGL